MYNNVLRYISLIFLIAFGCTASLWADNGLQRQFVLVIDAGHGGHDPGAISGGAKEKDINLNVALELGRLVENGCKDVKVVYTRKRDVFVSLQGRADIANRNKADLFISIHTNALPKGKMAYGAETYTLGMHRAASNLDVAKRENSVITYEANYRTAYQGFDPNKAESYVIFELMQDRYMKQSVDLARYIQRAYTSAGRPDKGVHQAGFLVLRAVSMPSVLTELGFITTPGECGYLVSASGVEQMAACIYNGFVKYRSIHHRDAPAALPAPIKPTPDVTHENATPETLTPTPSLREERPAAAEGKTEQLPVEVVPVETRPAPRRFEANKTVEKKPATQEKKTVTEKKTATEKKPVAEKKVATERKPLTEKKPVAEKKTTTTESKSTSEKKIATPSKQQTQSIVYRVQVGAGKVRVDDKDPQFKGLTVSRVKEGTMYKYYVGSHTSYAAASAALKQVQKKLPGAYLAAFVDGKSVSVQDARKAEKK